MRAVPLVALLLAVMLGAAWFATACIREQVSVALTPAPSALGKLAYVQDSDIWVKNLPDGTPQRITDHADNPNARPEWSPSGQWLRFMKGKQLGVMRADGSSARLYDTGWLAWSPVADRLAYTTNDGNLIVENADGSHPTAVAHWHSAPGLVGGLSEPAWSADGASLAYVEVRSEAGTPPTRRYAGIWRVPADASSSAVEVFNTGSPPQDGVGLIDWSRDGSILFYRTPFLTADLSDGITLHAWRPESANVVDFTPANPTMLLEPELRSQAPQGDLLAITDGGGRETWMGKRLAVVSPASGIVTDLTAADLAAIEPSWSPDATRIAYVAAPDAGVIPGGPAVESAMKAAMAPRKIFMVDELGGDPKQLTDDPAYRDEFPQWSADGSQILFARLDAQDRWSLWMTPSSGGTAHQVVPDISSNILGSTAPAWLGYYGLVPWHDVLDWWRGDQAASAGQSGSVAGVTPTSHPCAGPTPVGGGTPMGVGLVDVRSGSCQLLPIAGRVMRAQWVEPGKTLAAYDIDRKVFEIYDLTGRPIQEIDFKLPDTPDNAVHAAISTSPDGRTMLIDRDVMHTLTLRDVATGQERDFPKADGIDTDASFSPDGQHVAYVNISTGSRWLVIARADLQSGRFFEPRSVDVATEYLTPLAWSPDGRYLLIMTGKLGTPCVGSPDPACREFATQTWEVVDADNDGRSVWRSDTLLDPANARLTSVTWAGPDRLLIGQPEVRAKDRSLLPTTARWVDLPGGTARPAAAALADIDSIAPDGKHGARGGELVDLASLQRTRVAAYDVTYYWSWTQDSASALISFHGN